MREDVERLARYLDADTANALRSLLDRTERAEAEIVRMTADLNGLNAWAPIWQNDGKIWRERAEAAEAERDAAFAAGQALRNAAWNARLALAGQYSFDHAAAELDGALDAFEETSDGR